MAKQKKSKDIDLDIDTSELPNEEVSPEVEMDIESNSNMGSDTYEELLYKNEDLEKASLRAKADLDNALKRTLSEVEKAHKYGVEKLLSELLPVIDNLEHALNNLSENATKEDREGIELTLKSFESALDKFGMIPIYPVNEDFNPEKHEAVTMEKDENIIIDKQDPQLNEDTLLILIVPVKKTGCHH